ncbi:hypothetical protein NC652_032654 [Populus alba x Populus x berolinensis]|nr:hypothetical protein NC652_032654 [Populus alba x Populus x berolinensis]
MAVRTTTLFPFTPSLATLSLPQTYGPSSFGLFDRWRHHHNVIEKVSSPLNLPPLGTIFSTIIYSYLSLNHGYI